MKPFKKFLHGGDYNPNQWEKYVWEEDMRLFKKAHLNSASINIFSWAQLQPSENDYDFSELDDIMGLLTKEKQEIVLATATAAVPAWMFRKYPEVGRVDFKGRHHRFGQRHNACPNSLIYQMYSRRLAGKLAERYHMNPYLNCWHVNNEYGGECYCNNCEKAFRVWVQEKYETIEAVNAAWNFTFWGHTLYSWDDIVVPNELSEMMDEDNPAFAGIAIDYRRFMSDSLLNNFKAERDAIRVHDKETPITTNIMGTYKMLDYFKWAKEMDVISWDNYPAFDTPWSYVGMTHDLMRGLKQQAFMLMEQTPSQQNWQPYNSLKKPGQMRAQSYQTVAHGANTIQYFQLRRSKGGCEKFHGAVIEHVGTENTRVFKEVATLGEELSRVGEELLETKTHAQVGIMFDWDNYWGLEYTSGPSKDLKYVDQIHQYYRYFYHKNISVDMISLDSDLSKYDVIVAPVLYMMTEELGKRIENYVSSGGHFVTTFMSGLVDKTDNVHLGGYPGPLRKVAGIWVEEIDALAPAQHNDIAWSNGQTGSSTLLSDLIHLEGAESLGEYTSNFYTGMPVATKHSFGKGYAWYIGTELDSHSQAYVLDQVVSLSCVKPVLSEATLLEVTVRENDKNRYYFVMNFTTEAQDLPREFVGMTDKLRETVLVEGTRLAPYDSILIKRRK